jgi:hypothetical protein
VLVLIFKDLKILKNLVLRVFPCVDSVVVIWWCYTLAGELSSCLGMYPDLLAACVYLSVGQQIAAWKKCFEHKVYV